ncbi:hypothetical protein [Rhodobacter capsulatus]|uniref:hypothetical protein n=1 Tax=Rhodobacter capsulatus TaxID=1061 RepID=UPI0003D30C9A|nr:hypothetical protein [Rhodobacter capsulatus]ETD87355.1 hypothetical protein U716_00530 [Rhodobacter capsulatus B6]
MPFENDVFINCPFDEDYTPLLEALLFCVIYFGLNPRLATERLEGGQNRLDKIYALAKGAKYSIHDLSRCRAKEAGDYARMNMPFEFGVDVGIRRTAADLPSEKKFLIFENEPYETKRTLSDIAGQDIEFQRNDYLLVIKKTRNFFVVEAGLSLPGAGRIEGDYVTFLGWLLKLKIHEGHTAQEALSLPTPERLEAMRLWIDVGKPAEFVFD